MILALENYWSWHSHEYGQSATLLIGASDKNKSEKGFRDIIEMNWLFNFFDWSALLNLIQILAIWDWRYLGQEEQNTSFTEKIASSCKSILWTPSIPLIE